MHWLHSSQSKACDGQDGRRQRWCRAHSQRPTYGVNVNAVAEELGGRGGHHVILPILVLCMRSSNWRMMAHLHMPFTDMVACDWDHS